MSCPIRQFTACDIKCEWYNRDRNACSVKLIGESLSTVAYEARHGKIAAISEAISSSMTRLIEQVIDIKVTMKYRR